MTKRDKQSGHTNLTLTGNLYTLRGEHESAATHFKLAARIDRSSLSAWILLGHSYVELRNPTLAIEAYTRALGAVASCLSVCTAKCWCSY